MSDCIPAHIGPRCFSLIMMKSQEWWTRTQSHLQNVLNTANQENDPRKPPFGELCLALAPALVVVSLGYLFCQYLGTISTRKRKKQDAPSKYASDLFDSTYEEGDEMQYQNDGTVVVLFRALQFCSVLALLTLSVYNYATAFQSTLGGLRMGFYVSATATHPELILTCDAF